MYEQIRHIICEGEGILPEIFADNMKNRKRELVFARQAILFFMREFTKESLTLIGSYMGKDHATVIHACRTIKNLVDTDKGIRMKIHLYREKIKLILELTYEGDLKSIEFMRKNIEYCITNGIEIPDDVVQRYNSLIKSGTVNMNVDN